MNLSKLVRENNPTVLCNYCDWTTPLHTKQLLTVYKKHLEEIKCFEGQAEDNVKKVEKKEKSGKKELKKK